MCNRVGPWFAEAVLNIVPSPRTILPVVRVRMLTAVFTWKQAVLLVDSAVADGGKREVSKIECNL